MRRCNGENIQSTRTEIALVIHSLPDDFMNASRILLILKSFNFLPDYVKQSHLNRTFLTQTEPDTGIMIEGIGIGRIEFVCELSLFRENRTEFGNLCRI